MNFLQPLLLAALPLAALPIIIHLINQRRYQTMPWAAMMFLLAASRMSRGYARIRQWLILLFRALVIAALVFAISRPLASGWVGAAAGRSAETAIVLVDRSPSMQQRSSGSAVSKLETGTTQLARALETLGVPRVVLIENTTNEPRELESAAALRELPQLGPADASADLPAMMLAALDYIRANKLGQTDVWICSDLRENDWSANDGRWASLRDAFAEFDQRVRFHLLAYPQHASDNRAIRVSSVRREESSEGAEAFVSISLSLQSDRDPRSENASETVPVEFEIDGARSVVNVDFEGTAAELKDHRIPVGRGQTRGWGRVSIPADANPADNDFYFVFDVPPPRRTVIVTDDPAASRPLELAAGIAPAVGVTSTAEAIAPDALAAIAWEQVALVLWQAAIPRQEDAAMLQSFVDAGGQVIFFPPRTPDAEPIFGMQWEKWNEPGGVAVQSWRGDTGLLSNTLSGASLPVGQLRIDRYAGIQGEATPLATLAGGAPLLLRVATPRGGVYFCTTTPLEEDSSLAADGVVLYVMIQRALQSGAAALGNTHQQTAGEIATDPSARWRRLAGRDEGLSTEHQFHAGAYSTDERLLAINRPAREDRPTTLSDAKVEALFGDLHFDRVDDQAGNLQSLVQEIWRLFLIAMMVSMMVEAALCLPKKMGVSPPGTPRGATA